MLKMFLITGAGGFFGSGLMSYGANSMIHTAKLYALSEDLPIIIEIIDEDEKISTNDFDIKGLMNDLDTGDQQKDTYLHDVYHNFSHGIGYL